MRWNQFSRTWRRLTARPTTSTKDTLEIDTEFEESLLAMNRKLAEARDPAPATYRPDYRELQSQSSLHMGC